MSASNISPGAYVTSNWQQSGSPAQPAPVGQRAIRGGLVLALRVSGNQIRLPHSSLASPACQLGERSELRSLPNVKVPMFHACACTFGKKIHRPLHNPPMSDPK